MKSFHNNVGEEANIIGAIREISGWNRRSVSPLSNESSVQRRLDGVVNYATCTRPLDYIIACGYMRTKHSRVRRFEGRLESRSRKKNRSKLPCCHTGVAKRVVARSTSSSNYFRKRKCITTDHLFPRLLLHEGIRGDGWINLRIETFRREIENWKTVLRLYRFYQI